MNTKNKNLFYLAFSYLLIRYGFFSLHGMKDWPNFLALISLVIIVISIYFKKYKLQNFTLVGYVGGFIAGMLFNKDTFDPGGGRLNNAWIIWTIVFIITICTGIVLEIWYKRKT